jgi:hypothetical protein
MQTALERQQDAEQELWKFLEARSVERIELGDALRAVLSTTEATKRPALPIVIGKSHVGFAERHADFFRHLGIYVLDAVRASIDPKKIYAEIRSRAATFDLLLTPAPWNPPDRVQAV